MMLATVVSVRMCRMYIPYGLLASGIIYLLSAFYTIDSSTFSTMFARRPFRSQHGVSGNLTGTTCLGTTNSTQNQTTCFPSCEHGYFALPGMSACRPWLDCDEISQIRITGYLKKGGMKHVLMGRWENQTIAYLRFQTTFKNHFSKYLANYLLFQPNPLFARVVGYCEQKCLIVMEYYPLKNSWMLEEALWESNLVHSNSATALRLQLCVDYAQIVAFMHGEGRIMCDTNNLSKLSSQYLLTDDFRLVAADVDHLQEASSPCPVWFAKDWRFVSPETKKMSRKKCTHVVGLQQRACADELKQLQFKADVWKMPDVCLLYLSRNPETNEIMDARSERVAGYLDTLHGRCKLRDPRKRPDAVEVLSTYLRAQKELFAPE
ncbi:PREDICTED: protein O-mannose kinase-like [Priapulus caudatus]|uniref:Protein O-mannose kinase-like n=1 Tax=Priapulus caudatus TaxID=37621 RepID=A0ABM1DZR1_PRICU|nr:PREDICTED: protein O-mannose kinase-like [Priapulus caudatus]